MKSFISLSVAILILVLISGGQVSAQTCAPVAPNLVSWYAADNNALDSRSRNNGILQNGATFAAGQVGQSYIFDGGDDHVSMPSAAFHEAFSQLTLEAWVFPTSHGSGDGIFGRAVISNTETDGFGLRVFNGFLQADIRLTSGNATVTANTNQLVLNQWSHIAVSYDGSQIAGYVNGNQVFAQPATGTIRNTANANVCLLIGSDPTTGCAVQSNSLSWAGQIDEVSIYNRALSASETAAIFIAGTAGKCKPTATLAPSGQVAWLAGDGDARDIAGTSDGTLQNGAAFGIGKVGQSFNLDGSDDSVQLPLNQSFQIFTLEVWVKPLSAVNDPINQELILGQAGFGAQLAVIPGTNGGMRVKIQYRDTVNSFAQLTSTVDIPLNDWSLLTGTYDGTALKLYINGVLNAQTNPANTTVQTCNTPYFIGGFQPVTDCNAITNPPFQFFNGLIDEAAIYNRALTDAEITSIFNAGIAGKLKQNAMVDSGSLISLWQGENNANDVRGANNGTFAANTYGSGKVGQAFQTNDGRITVPDSPSLDFTNAYTIEMWVAPAAAGTAGGFTFFACKGNCNVANNQPYSLLFLDTRKVDLTVGNNSTIDRLSSNSALPLNSFSHVAGTYDGATMRIYINGVLDSSKPTAVGTLVNSSNPFVFGGSDQFGNTPGVYDEVALYNRALTAAEVRANYEAGNALSTVVGDAQITFPNISAAGTTQQIPLDKNLFPVLPMGAMHTGLFYDIATSAVFTGNPTVCFNLPSFTPAQFACLGVMHFENNNWVNVTAASNTYPTLCTVPIQSFSPFGIVNFAPTAATVSISGRVREAGGKGIAQAQVSLIGASGETRSVSTNQFGFYRFDDVAAGETYVLTVSQKRRVFPDSPRVLFVSEELSEIDFTATADGL